MAVVAGEAVHFVFELLEAEVDFAFRFAFFRAELGTVGEDCFAALFIVWGDVDDERGAQVLRERSS